MATAKNFESLERRTFYAATSPGFDPNFLYDSADMRRIAGNNTAVYDAVAAPGDRTFLLAERFAEPDSETYGQPGILTLVAVTADGKLDQTFGTGGVALTQRYVEHSNLEPPGLLRLDDAGRLYFSDGKRVMRFRKNGTADTSFGTRGVVQFAPNSRPVQLCDIVPVGDSVYLATNATRKGIEYFAVQRADGRRVRTIFQASDSLGLPYLTGDGSFTHLARETAAFAKSAGGLIMVRLESDYAEGAGIDPESGEYETTIDTQSETAVVTRFTPDGQGVDILRTEARLLDGIGVGLDAIVLSDSGKTAIVKTGRELLRMNLSARTSRRYDLPGNLDPFEYGYDLMPDGKVYLIDHSTPDRTKPEKIARFLLTGQLDTTFAKKGVLTIQERTDLDGYSLRRFFLSDSGRLYVTAENSFLYTNYFTIRRL